MRARTNQSGFSVVELVVVLVIVALLGAAGYVVYNRHANSKPAATAASQSATANDVPTAPEVNSSSELDQEQSVLDQTDISSSNDTAQLNSQLQSF